MKYLENWKQSWIDLFNNLKLLIPDLVFLILSALLGFVILYISGLFPVFKTVYVDKNLDVITNSLVRVIVAGGIFFVTTFILGSGIRAVKYNYINDVLKKKKVKLSKFFDYSSKDVLNIIKLRVLLFLIGVVVTSVVVILSFISSFFLVLFPVIGIVYALAFLFVYPIMFLKKKNALDSVKLSFNIFRKKTLHVFIVGFIVILTSMIFSVMGSLVQISYFSTVIGTIISLFVGVWSFIYLFKAL